MNWRKKANSQSQIMCVAVSDKGYQISCPKPKE